MRPGPETAPSPAGDPRLQALLRDLGDQVRPGGGPRFTTPPLATGIPSLDQLLGGGLPAGRLSEVGGPASSGRTSLGLSLLARTTLRGEFAAWVDWADAFDPASAEAAGVDLGRVLWIRPDGIETALRCADQVLRAGGFALVGLDLAKANEAAPRIPASTWPRLRKHAAATGAAVVALTASTLLGSAADLGLEFGTAQPRFGEGPDWLEGLDTRVALVRNRAGRGSGQAPVSFRTIRAA